MLEQNLIFVNGWQRKPSNTLETFQPRRQSDSKKKLMKNLFSKFNILLKQQPENCIGNEMKNQSEAELTCAQCCYYKNDINFYITGFVS